MVSKPAVSKYHYNVDGDLETSKLIASSSIELCSVVVTATGSAIAARIYDTDSSARKDPKQSLLLAANTGESTSYTPAQPVLYKNGLYVEIEMGGGVGGEVFLTYQ